MRGRRALPAGRLDAQSGTVIPVRVLRARLPIFSDAFRSFETRIKDFSARALS